jgi:hypothetical protein
LIGSLIGNGALAAPFFIGVGVVRHQQADRLRCGELKNAYLKGSGLAEECRQGNEGRALMMRHDSAP